MEFDIMTDYVLKKMARIHCARGPKNCKICKECTYPDGEECRFPDKAVASVEAYCIDVNALVTSCDIPYINGPNTVSFVGLFLFKS